MADKNFKVKTSITSPTPIALTEGGTGQTTANNALNAILPVQTSSAGYYLKTDGTNTSWSAVTSTYAPMPSTSVSSDITLSSNNGYFIDTTSARTLTLPASPSVGDEVHIFDASNNASTNNITVQPNGNKILGSVQNLIIDTSAAAAVLIYTGSTYGWNVN